MEGITHLQLKTDDSGNSVVIDKDGKTRPFIDELAKSDVTVNGILQDTDAPVMFVKEDEVVKLKKNTLIVDVSCDEGMGFFGAKPTSFENPMFKVGHVNYYAVDHTPSYLWDSVSWEISKAILPFLKELIRGPNSWKENKILKLALEMEKGVIINSKILSFQKRLEKYPHNMI